MTFKQAHQISGRMGGKPGVKNPLKARPREQYLRMAAIRWAKHKAKANLQNTEHAKSIEPVKK